MDTETELTKDHLSELFDGAVLDLAVAMFDGWALRTVQDLARHGADAGWPGLTYTSEAAELFDAHAETIWDMAVDLAESLGENVATMIGGFGRVDMAESWASFRNLMAWFAAEELARQIDERAAELEPAEADEEDA